MISHANENNLFSSSFASIWIATRSKYQKSWLGLAFHRVVFKDNNIQAYSITYIFNNIIFSIALCPIDDSNMFCGIGYLLSSFSISDKLGLCLWKWINFWRVVLSKLKKWIHWFWNRNPRVLIFIFCTRIYIFFLLEMQN